MPLLWMIFEISDLLLYHSIKGISQYYYSIMMILNDKWCLCSERCINISNTYLIHLYFCLSISLFTCVCLDVGTKIAFQRLSLCVCVRSVTNPHLASQLSSRPRDQVYKLTISFFRKIDGFEVVGMKMSPGGGGGGRGGSLGRQNTVQVFPPLKGLTSFSPRFRERSTETSRA